MIHPIAISKVLLAVLAVTAVSQSQALALTLSGNISYSFNTATNKVQFHVDTISNPAATATGPLRLELWAFLPGEGPTAIDFPNIGPDYGQGEPRNTMIAASDSLGTLGAGQSLTDVTVTVPFSPANKGTYYPALVLDGLEPCFPVGCYSAYKYFSSPLTFPLTAQPPPIKIGNYISGNWDNPTEGQGGHGFQFEILPNNGILAIWFVFTPDGKGQTWLYSQGAYDPNSNTVTLPTFLSLGARFPPYFNSADNHVTQWGTMTFTFTDCNNGTMSWYTSTAVNEQQTGTMPIARVTGIAGLTCP